MDETDKLISIGGIRFDDIQDYEETISFIINPFGIIHRSIRPFGARA